MKKVKMLSKEEMKKVTGGAECSAVLDGGATKTFQCEGSASACQTTAEANCANTPGCVSVTCS